MTITILLLSFLILFASNVNAESTSVSNEIKIESNSNTSNDSICDTSVKNYVKINGKVVVDEDTVKPCAVNSEIDVKVENNEGTVKYKVNGEEKTIIITPDDSKNDDSNQATEDKKESNKESAKNSDKKEANVFERIAEAVESFFSRLASIFS